MVDRSGHYVAAFLRFWFDLPSLRWSAMSKLYEKTKEEIIALVPPTLFFFVALHVIAIVRVLMVKGTGLPVATTAQIAVGALILGKAVLIADLLPVVNRYPDKPLIYNIIWKTAIYFLVALLIHYLERLVDFWREAGSFVAGNQKLLAEIVWPHFWAIQIILLVLILNYCFIRELARVIGADKVRAMFFGSHPGTRI
jgi:hypothetical protein